MTRQHAAGYTPAHDPYAEHRCECDHLVYPGLRPTEGRCPWAHLGCRCADHKPARVAGSDNTCLPAETRRSEPDGTVSPVPHVDGAA